ncbi:MAG: radical SAM protein, partial [Bacteroidota bacterium]
MKNVTYLIGVKKKIYNSYIKLYVFFYFLRQMLTGNLPTKHFVRFLKRLLFFLSKLEKNKYVKSGNFTKMNLYVPAFPSEAFFKACRKVMISDEKMPCISVLLSVTSACRYNCEHCYQKLDKGKDAEINLVCDAVKLLDKKGVSFFNIEGGEPFLIFDKLKKVCESISVGEIWINSTGDGMTLEKLKILKSLGVKGIIFSLHSDVQEKINEFMKRDDAWYTLKSGMEKCHQAGLEVAANSCLMKEDFYNDNFHSVMKTAKNLGVSILQLIKPKPAGGWLGEEVSKFTSKDLKFVEKLTDDYNNKPEFKNYPFIAAQIVDERSDMFGCTAGGTDRFYINAKGDVQPCEFLN